MNVAGGRAGTPYSYYYPYCNNKGMCHIGLEKGKQGEYLTDRLTDEAVAFIKESAHGENPFSFIWHTMQCILLLQLRRVLWINMRRKSKVNIIQIQSMRQWLKHWIIV